STPHRIRDADQSTGLVIEVLEATTIRSADAGDTITGVFNVDIPAAFMRKLCNLPVSIPGNNNRGRRTAARTQPAAGRGKRPPATVVICNHQDAIAARAQFEAASLWRDCLVEPIIFPYAAVPNYTGSREIALAATGEHQTTT